MIWYNEVIQVSDMALPSAFTKLKQLSLPGKTVKSLGSIIVSNDEEAKVVIIVNISSG